MHSKHIIVLTMAVLMVIVAGPSAFEPLHAATDNAPAGEPLHFEDPALDRAVRTYIGKMEGPLYASDVDWIERLYIEWPEPEDMIRSLEGIQALTSLEALGMPGHEISDLSPLAHLDHLYFVNLTENQVADTSPLANAGELEHLDLRRNNIHDVSGLSNVTSLRVLYLGNNNVQNLEPLAGLEQLQMLGLEHNGLVDVAPLAGLPNLHAAAIFGNAGLDLCPGVPARLVIDDLVMGGVEVLYEERAGSEACADVAQLSPLRIAKQVAGTEETVIVRGGELNRFNADGSQLLVTCTGTAQVATYLNHESGVYWKGLFPELLDDLANTIVLRLLPDDPSLRYAVQIKVEEMGMATVAGYATEHYRVLWRPSADEGGNDMPWKVLQEVWVAPELAGELIDRQCHLVVTVVELYQFLESAFSSQHYYGLAGSMEYTEMFLGGFPMRVKVYEPHSEVEAFTAEVTDVNEGPVSEDMIAIPASLEEVNTVSEVLF